MQIPLDHVGGGERECAGGPGPTALPLRETPRVALAPPTPGPFCHLVYSATPSVLSPLFARIVVAPEVAPRGVETLVAELRLDLAHLGPRVLQRPRDGVAQGVHAARAQPLLADVRQAAHVERVPEGAVVRQAHPERALLRDPIRCAGTCRHQGTCLPLLRPVRLLFAAAAASAAAAAAPAPAAVAVEAAYPRNQGFRGRSLATAARQHVAHRLATLAAGPDDLHARSADAQVLAPHAGQLGQAATRMQPDQQQGIVALPRGAGPISGREPGAA